MKRKAAKHVLPAETIAIVRVGLHHRPTHAYQSVLKQHDPGDLLLVLLAMIAIAFAILVAVQRIEMMRRTGSAAVLVLATELQLGSRYEQSPTGKWITYEYLVDGSSYPGRDFRRWLNVPAHEPKVCFDPDNPKDHLLVEGRVTCGA
jgi:hypothetical protein